MLLKNGSNLKIKLKNREKFNRNRIDYGRCLSVRGKFDKSLKRMLMSDSSYNKEGNRSDLRL